MIDIEFYNPEDLDKTLKATIHKTGKLGFSEEAAKKMELGEGQSFNIGKNKADINDKNLYMMKYNDTTGSFKLYKAGKYFYMNGKILFDNLKLDYVNNTITFNISTIDNNGSKMYKLSMKQKEKESNNN
jgi:hypothetical protein